METKKTEAIQSGRRDFLKLSAVTVAAGAVATASTANLQKTLKFQMVIIKANR